MSCAVWPLDSPLPFAPPLDQDAVHVWCASLGHPPVPEERLLDVLSEEERAVADRYRVERDRWLSGASRALLRWLLGSYLGIKPEQVRLRLGPHGKPELAGSHAVSGLQFNVSHTEEIALYAVTYNRAIGTDIERVRPMPNANALAARFFTPAESAALRALPGDLRDESFLLCWTRKEAFIKARGEGLSLPLDEFEVQVHRGDGADRLRIPARPEETARWLLRDLRPTAGFVGTLAVPDRRVHVRCRRWERVG